MNNRKAKLLFIEKYEPFRISNRKWLAILTALETRRFISTAVVLPRTDGKIMQSEAMVSDGEEYGRIKKAV